MHFPSLGNPQLGYYKITCWFVVIDASEIPKNQSLSRAQFATFCRSAKLGRPTVNRPFQCKIHHFVNFTYLQASTLNCNKVLLNIASWELIKIFTDLAHCASSVS